VQRIPNFGEIQSTYTYSLYSVPQGQYWAGRTPRPNNGTPNMAAANFVVITLSPSLEGGGANPWLHDMIRRE